VPPAGPKCPFPHETEYNGSAKEYIRAPLIVDDYPPYDDILVDGVARIACLEHLATGYGLKEDGFIFLHDAHRAEYSAAKQLFETIAE